MHQLLSTIIFVALLALSGSMAEASSLAVNDTLSDQASSQADLTRPRRRANYEVRWRDVNTGQDISGWVRSNQPICNHNDNCSCGGANYCGPHQVGTQVYYWDRGCGENPRVIVCEQR